MNTPHGAAIGAPQGPRSGRELSWCTFKFEGQWLSQPCLPEGTGHVVVSKARCLGKPALGSATWRGAGMCPAWGALHASAGGVCGRRDSAPPAPSRRSDPPAGRLRPLAERGRQRRPPLVLLLEAGLAVDGPRHHVVAELGQRLARPPARGHGPAWAGERGPPAGPAAAPAAPQRCPRPEPRLCLRPLPGLGQGELAPPQPRLYGRPRPDALFTGKQRDPAPGRPGRRLRAPSPRCPLVSPAPAGAPERPPRQRPCPRAGAALQRRRPAGRAPGLRSGAGRTHTNPPTGDDGLRPSAAAP